jgi:hypothetical protein
MKLKPIRYFLYASIATVITVGALMIGCAGGGTSTGGSTSSTGSSGSSVALCGSCSVSAQCEPGVKCRLFSDGYKRCFSTAYIDSCGGLGGPVNSTYY